MNFQDFYKYSGHGQGKKAGAHFGVGKQASRISIFNRKNPLIEAQIDKIKISIHSRALLMVDKSFENRYIPLLNHLIDIGYFSDSITTKVINDDIDETIIMLNEHYNNGYRLFFGTHKSSTFIGLREWFTNHPDTLYFNSGSRLWINQLDDHIPDNMITTTCNNYRIIKFIFDNIICNIHKHSDFLLDSPFSNIFNFVDDSLANGQVFNQIVYISDNADLQIKNNFTDILKNYININFSNDTQFNDPVTLKTFVLNTNKTNEIPTDLDTLLCENPINGRQFSSSQTKSIFIVDCFNSNNCQSILNYFSKKEYYNNLIIFNDKFLNTLSEPFYSKYNFEYSFILAVNYSELGYKISRQLFSDYNTPLNFIDIFSHLLDIFDRAVSSKVSNPTGRLIEYLTNSFSIDRNEWHVKPLYLYGLKERYDETLNRWIFYSSATIFKKSFNDTNTGTATPDESWMDTAISSYPTASGAVSYSTNNKNYKSTDINNVSMLFSSLQEITDYKDKLDSFFKGTYKSSTYNGGANPNSTPSVFGIWKSLVSLSNINSLSNTADYTTMSMNTKSISNTIVINVTAPSEALINGSSTNKNYWFYVNYGPINYYYNSYDSTGKLISATADNVTIDLDLTYSSDNYLVFFNKGNSYSNVRGPLLVYFKMFANQVVNKQYRIGDVININNSSLGTDVNATIDSISSDGFTFGVTRFENENTNGITSTILKQNTGIAMSLANSNSSAIMTVNPDITNVSNNAHNLWSGNGCYYLAMLPSGALVANDYRTGLRFFTLGSDPSAVSLRFRIESPNYLELQLLNSSGAKIKNIIKHAVTANLLVFPLQLTITNDRNIAIVNANNAILWSENTGIYTSLTNGSTISNNGNYSSLYSLNGIYNLYLSSNGVLNFTNVTTNKNIYNPNSAATSLKFSYTTNSSSTTFTLGLYNSSNTQVYNILNDGIYTSSTSFDISNNKLITLPFVDPYTFKISNNGDLVIIDTNNNICWKLKQADKTTVTQDLYDVSGNLTSVITGLSYLHPRQGDLATIHNPTNPLYNNATATIAIVNSDKSIKAVFYDETDTTVRSKIIYDKPDLRSMLSTDNGSTSGQNFMPVSNTELFNLTSENEYFTAKIDETGIVKVIDNRTGRVMWTSQSLDIPTGETLFLCNGLILDNNTGSLYISVSTKDEKGNIIKDPSGNIIQNNYYIFESKTNSNSSNNNVAYYSLNMQDDGNLCVYQNNNNGTVVGLWCSMAWQTESWSSNSGVIQAFQYNIHSANLVSPNGNYFLAMDQGYLGVLSYNNGSYTWLDSCFKYIGKPFFYSGQSDVTAYESESSNNNGAQKTVYTSGTLWNNYSNFDGKHDTGGYWSNIYNNVINNFSFSNSDPKNLVDTVSTIWVSSDATYNTKTHSGTYNFYYTYNNPTVNTIFAELWVSVVEQCDLYISSVSSSKITTIGGNSSSNWNNLYKYDFDLPPGDTYFKFLNTRNTGGRCGLAFMCFPKYVSSCDLYINSSNGNLMVENVTTLAKDNSTVKISGIYDTGAYSITNLTNISSGPYTLSFDNDGSEGSSGILSIKNNGGTDIFKSKAGTDLDQNIIVPDDRNGILKAGIKLYAQQDENEMESFLWSPSEYSFFGVQVDASNNKQIIGIFDARFTSPVYTFYSPQYKYTSLTSADAIAYLMLSTEGAIVAYNNIGTIIWQTPNITGYTNYSLAIDDQNVLRINGNNGATVVAVATYNQTWGSFENNYLSNWTGSFWGKGFQRIITSANGDYTLVMDNGSLKINSVIDNSYISNSSSNSKDISTTQLYSTLYSYTGTSPSSVYLTFDTDGVLRIHDSTSVLYSFGTSNQGIPNYKMVLSNTGELAVYDCSIPRAAAIDSCSVSNGWSAVLWSYNNKLYIGNYGYNNYRWIWNAPNSAPGGPGVTAETVNFYTTYTNTDPSNNISATLYYSVDDSLDIYMNGNKINSSTVPYNVVWAVGIQLKPGTNFFKFSAYNKGGPAGLIFWCLDNNNTNDATNTLFFSNPDTVYCSDGIVMNTNEFGIQTWSSGTSYSEIVPYSNYSIDTSDIPENQIVSIENSFKIPSSSDDTEEYTKIYSQNRLYYLRLEIDGTLSIYLSNSNKKIWSNRRPYSGPNNAARIGFNNGSFGLWDSKGISYGTTIKITDKYIYVFYLGNDRFLRLVGSDGSSTVFNP